MGGEQEVSIAKGRCQKSDASSCYVLRTRALPEASRKLAKAGAAVVGDVIESKELLYNFELLLTEACSNVVRHAYRGMDPGDVEISVAVHKPDRIELTVTDWGRGLDMEPRDITNACPESDCGRGLFIISALADDICFERRDGKNIVRMTVHVQEETWKS